MDESRTVSLASPGKARVADWFDDLASALLLKHYLCIGKEKYLITEIEFYLHNSSHPDPYAHRHERQLSCREWYFHRERAAARSFTRKGLDITFGDAKSYGGILIRALRREKDSKDIEGPSKVVDEILDVLKVGHVQDLFREKDWSNKIFQAKAPLFIGTESDMLDVPISITKRHGLSDRHDKDYREAPYRYRIYPEACKKVKQKAVRFI
jgi:hypothetical protein